MSYKILVVEDNAVESVALVNLLQQYDFTGIQAGDAKEAIKAFRAEEPNLVLLDVNLPPKVLFDCPKWDGLDFLNWMNSMANNPVPVILLTGASIDKIQSRLDAAHPVYYFQKPANPAELVDAIQRALNIVSPAVPEGVSE